MWHNEIEKSTQISWQSLASWQKVGIKEFFNESRWKSIDTCPKDTNVLCRLSVYSYLAKVGSNLCPIVCLLACRAVSWADCKVSPYGSQVVAVTPPLLRSCPLLTVYLQQLQRQPLAPHPKNVQLSWHQVASRWLTWLSSSEKKVENWKAKNERKSVNNQDENDDDDDSAPVDSLLLSLSFVEHLIIRNSISLRFKLSRLRIQLPSQVLIPRFKLSSEGSFHRTA